MYALGDLQKHLGDLVLGVDGDALRTFRRPMPIGSAEPDALAFCGRNRKDGADLVRATRAACVLCGLELRDQLAGMPDGTLMTLRVYVDNPRLAFARVGQALFKKRLPPGIHPSAVVDPGASIHPTAHIGAGAFVGRATIGEGSVVWPRAVVLDDVTIGRNVVVRSGAVLGTDGFGYEQNEAGAWEHLPHTGGVVIEDDVEIGANVTVAKGTMGNTVLRRGAKLDNLVHVAHNVDVGPDTLVIATAHLSGGAKIGARTWIAPGAAITDNIKVGDDVFVGLGSVVMKDVPDGAKVMGQPAALLPERFWNKKP
jgi:UDP-3-O-[3-hydroxymyristoyl] glucosamine N-acyltransferase